MVRLGRTIPCEVVEQASSGVHRVSFTPDGAGQYKIHVLFNNIEVKGVVNFQNVPIFCFFAYKEEAMFGEILRNIMNIQRLANSNFFLLSQLYGTTNFVGSPFILDIADASSVSVFGENLRMASVDRLSVFMIHAVGAECKDITVTVTG